MPLHLVLGPAGSGKTTRAIQAFIHALDEGSNPLFIAPTGPDARHFERQILSMKDPITGGKVTTFGGICREILSAAEPGLDVLDSGGRLILIREVIDASPELGILGASSGFSGFVSALAELFSELELLGVGPGELRNILTPWSKGNNWRVGLAGDLFYLYGNYRAALRQLGACDTEIVQSKALAYLEDGSVALPYAPVIIDGFWDFTSLQHRLIQTLSGNPGEHLVTLPFEPGKEAYAAPAHHVKLLAGVTEPEVMPSRDGGNRSPALKHLVDNLFDEEQPKVRMADEDIVILKAAGLRGQAELLAATILKLWRSGESLDDMAVICRSIDRDLIAVAAALEDYGVPYELPAPVPLGRTPVGKAALAALSFAAGLECRASMLSLLSSDLSTEPDELVDRFDVYTRVHGTQERKGLLRAWEKQGGRPLTELNRLVSAAGEGVEALGARLCDLMSGLVSKNISGADLSTDDLSLDLLALKSLQSVCGEAARAAAAMERMATENSSHQAGLSSGSQNNTSLLRRGVEMASLRVPVAQRRGCVRLLDPHRVLNQRFDIIFLCGLLEKQFPSLGREDAFFSDAARRELAERHGLDLDTRDRRLEEERFLFHRTVSRARKKLYLCYPYCDKEGKPTIRSLFVEDALGLFEKASIQMVERPIGEVTFKAPDAPTADQALKSLALESAAGASAIAAAEPAGPGLKRRLIHCLAAAERREPALADPRILESLEKQNEFAVTGLQRYLRCPFRYFVENLLEPNDIGPVAHGLRRGRLVHRILCRFGEILGEQNLVLADADKNLLGHAKQKMHEIIEAEFAGAGSDLETVILKTELDYHLDRYVDREHQSGRHVQIYDVEVSFGGDLRSNCGGKESTDETLDLDGGVRLRGRIDRIDRAPGQEWAMVIDYKASKSTVAQAMFEKKKEIQIPLYMQALKIFGLTPVGGEYYAIRGEERAGLYLADYSDLLGAGKGEPAGKDFVEADVFDERLGTARELALEAVAGIRRGDFPCEPLPGECRYCELGGVCRRGETKEAAVGRRNGEDS